MPQQPTTATDLLWFALETYRDEYRDLSDTWARLDTKAQGLGAIAGIFLAAVFAWARETPAGFGTLERFLLVGGIALLVATVIAAVLALQVRTVDAPPLGDAVVDMVKEILERQKVDDPAERIRRLYHDQNRLWSGVNAGMLGHCRRKGTALVIGQWTLLTAGILVAALAIVVSVGPH